MTRLNITIPDELFIDIRRFKNKSRFIAEAIQEKIKLLKQKELEAKLVEGYKSSRNESAEIENDWSSATIEKWE